MLSLGIDIGTSKISLNVIDLSTGLSLANYNLANNSNIPTDNETFRCQDPLKIRNITLDLLEKALNDYPDIKSIGITGQMHGILYVDKFNEIKSPLFTWQDQSGNLLIDESTSYAERLSLLTKYKMASGYGITTYYYHQKNHIHYGSASYITTIHSHIGSYLANNTELLLHNSDAHSLGLFDLKKKSFDKEAFKNASLDFSIMPKTSSAFLPLGYYKDKILVALALGDNQASVIGSGTSKQDILLNIGTGSQVSIITNKSKNKEDNIEIRPLAYNDNIFVGAALSGGHSFYLLKRFFEQAFSMANLQAPDNLYQIMIEEVLKTDIKNPLEFNTLFNGSRDNPRKRASIENIEEKNFNPAHLIDATAAGIINELYMMYQAMDKKDFTPKRIIGCGNGIRKNILLIKQIKKIFDLPLVMPINQEEAAFGASLAAGIASGYFRNLEEAQRIIKFQNI